MDPIKICRICLTFSSANHIPKTRRNDLSFRRFCSEINYKEEVELEQENVTICVKCMPLVESVSDSKCRVEEVEGQVLKLQRKLLRLLNELEEEISEHFKGMEKLEEIVEGSSLQPDVFERVGNADIKNVMKFRKGIVEVAQDLRRFRVDIRQKIMVPLSPQLEQQLFIKVEAETIYSPPSSPLEDVESDGGDALWFPEANDDEDDPLRFSEDDGDNSIPRPPQDKPRFGKRTFSFDKHDALLSSGSEDDTPAKRRKEGGGLEFLSGKCGRKQLIYEDFRYNFYQKDGSRTSWACAQSNHKKCRAQVQSENNEVVDVTEDHNHAHEKEKIKGMRIIKKIKQCGSSNIATIRSIIAKEGERGDGIKAKLPHVKTIARMMRQRNQKLQLADEPDDDFDEDLSGPIEFVKSARGKDHLIFKGFRFRLKRETAQKKNWVCTENRDGGCKAYLHTINNEVTRYKPNHNHAADASKLEVVKIRQKFKEASLSTTKTTSEILTSSIAGVSDDVAAKLRPSLITLANRIRLKRKRSAKVKTSGTAASTVNEMKVVSITSPLEFVKSRRGNEHLIFEGYRYFLNHRAKVKGSWCCLLSKNGGSRAPCSARLQLKDGCVVLYRNEHNHPPENAEKIKRKKLLENIKESCLASADTPSALLAETDLGSLNAETVKRMIRKIRSEANKSSVKPESVKDMILRNYPEIFLMEEFMQEVVIAMIASEERRSKNSKSSDQFEDPSFKYTFRFDWSEKKIFLGEVEIVVNEKLKTVQCLLCGKRVGPAAASVLAIQIFDHIVGEHYDAYNCPICVEKLTNHKEFQEHVSDHIDPKEPCEICGKPVTARMLEFHKATHLGAQEKERARKQRKHTCAICGKNFATSSSVRRHERKH